LSEEAPDGERSKTQQQKLNVEINHSAQRLIQERLLPDLQNVVSPLCQAHLDRHDPHTINIEYPAVFAPGYLRPVVRLEIGPLAAMLPMEFRPGQSTQQRRPGPFASCHLIFIWRRWSKTTMICLR